MDVKTPNLSETAMRPVGLIIRQKDPNNLEMPFDQLGDFISRPSCFIYAVISQRRSWILSHIGCR